MTSPIGRDDWPYGIPGPRFDPRTCTMAVSDPCPVVAMSSLITRDEVVTPIRSAYAATKPPPASPIGSTDTSVAGGQPEAMTSPACSDDSGPMESAAISMRTLCWASLLWQRPTPS
jgi:hypothetical protein